MIFNSYYFFIFFGLIFFGYWILPKSFSKFFLCLASIFFYSTFTKGYVFLLALMIVAVFWASFLIERKRNRLVLSIFILLTSTPLIFYKYSFNNYSLIAPIGISFFTFELIHYLVDIYNKKSKPLKSFLDFAVFCLFFPTQLAGPIKRFEDFVPQLKRGKFDPKLLLSGILLIILGLFQKVVIADSCVKVVRLVFDTQTNQAGGDIWLGTFLFAFQIFFDFSGYSNIGIGLAACLGINIPSNFKNPYLSSSLGSFWRRWHISLMEWLKDYVYIPLGGSQKGKVRRLINTLSVFLISGLWHGAALHFVVWGAYHGLLVNLERFWPRLKSESLWLTILKKLKIIHALKVIATFLVVCVGWIFFRTSSVTNALNLLKYAAIDPTKITIEPNIYLQPVLLVCLLIIGFILREVVAYVIKRFPLLQRFNVLFYSVGYSFLVIAILVYFNEPKVQFIYFQF